MNKSKVLSFVLVLNLFLSASAVAGHHSEKKFFKRDLNGDGLVSQEEYVSASVEKFQKMDTNNNGSIDQDEYAAAKQLWKQKHKKHHGHQEHHDQGSQSEE